MHNAWNGAQFDHIAASLGFRSSLHRALNHTETVLFGVFSFPDVYSYGSSIVLHDLDLGQHYGARFTAIHVQDGAPAVHRNCYLWIMCDFGHSLITEQPLLVRGPLCRETQIMPKPCFSSCLSLTCFMGISPGSVTWLILQRTKWMGAHSGHVALVSWKRHFLCIMRNFGNSCLTDMRIMAGGVLRI